MVIRRARHPDVKISIGYRDETVELSTSVGRPSPTAKGLSEVAKGRRNQGDDAAIGVLAANRDGPIETCVPFQEERPQCHQATIHRRTFVL